MDTTFAETLLVLSDFQALWGGGLSGVGEGGGLQGKKKITTLLGKPI